MKTSVCETTKVNLTSLFCGLQLILQLGSFGPSLSFVTCFADILGCLSLFCGI